MKPPLIALLFVLDFLKVLLLSIFAGLKILFKQVFIRKRKNISEQLALVTGGGNGLGREICLKLAQEGCNLAVVDLDYEAAKVTADKAKMYGVDATPYQIDVSDFMAVEKLRKMVNADMGPVDILINNAGVNFTGPIVEEHPLKIQKFMDINLMAYFWTTRVFLPHMIKRKHGHIVGVSSIAAYFPNPNVATYTTSKFGIRGFMEALNHDLYIQGHESYIKTTCAFPYYISTTKSLEERVRTICKYRYTVTPETTAEHIVEGIVYNYETIMIPPIASVLFYINCPRFFQKIYLDVMFKFNSGEKWHIDNDLW
uniref:Short-chain dehydrogenase/reductase 3 n=1 Tax=Culicoides sonorensis TaxID=179676 RepID=A0A336LIN3_CULSO